LPFKCNLQRYIMVQEELDKTEVTAAELRALFEVGLHKL
jgi:hypothetical protein